MAADTSRGLCIVAGVVAAGKVLQQCVCDSVHMSVCDRVRVGASGGGGLQAAVCRLSVATHVHEEMKAIGLIVVPESTVLRTEQLAIETGFAGIRAVPSADTDDVTDSCGGWQRRECREGARRH